MHPLTWFTIMYGVHYLLIPKADLEVIFRLLMIILVTGGFTLWKFVMNFFDIYHMFHTMVKTQHNVVIKCFRCDLADEYTSNKFSKLLAYDYTIHQTSCTDTPQQNGVDEIKNCHIVNIVCSLLLYA